MPINDPKNGEIWSFNSIHNKKEVKFLWVIIISSGNIIIEYENFNPNRDKYVVSKSIFLSEYTFLYNNIIESEIAEIIE